MEDPRKGVTSYCLSGSGDESPLRDRATEELFSSSV
jgi:hypothetical protein